MLYFIKNIRGRSHDTYALRNISLNYTMFAVQASAVYQCTHIYLLRKIGLFILYKNTIVLPFLRSVYVIVFRNK